ncbi:TPA: hypothetical protein ACV5NF_003683 [Pseudomonas aeruginosa]|uniref:hypothetical protein n=1 Tax=Pseudomonas aeruginosa TaxID=287 RepID=UPI0003B9BE44|nr:hypothetical protein [Pseudomonas aeruginosa]ALY72091.1 hypothetical protein HW04_13925 [Pseudomonas aeruginosa]ALY79545.1 hypothetical protein HW03_22935 [Pseudomonas aeruginosa]ERV83391.1 hypothetical protein Q040_04281 [Pseudomonas aeruginosa BWHPSA027]KSM60662.1 hypothetical protein APA70_31465 [Pseudomonas aeruginosa]MBG4450797.1 hypothetical protein [Pseudomonas aeruginosa]
MNTRIPGRIADDAVEAVSYGREQTQWLAALAAAIKLDLKHNEGREAMELARLVHYLAGDCHNYLDCEVVRLRKEIDGAEAMQ